MKQAEPVPAGHNKVEVAGTSADLNQLYRDNAAFAWRLFMNMGVRPDDVADMVQDVFLVVHRRLGEVVIRSSARAWIYGICVRCCANYRRRAGIRREQLVADPPESGSEDFDAVNARLDLKRALELLDDQQRAIFLLYEVEGLPMSEVAEALSSSLSTAYAKLYAARRLVQRAFSSNHSSHQVGGRL